MGSRRGSVVKHTYRMENDVAVLELHGKIMGEAEDLKVLELNHKFIGDDIRKVVMDFCEVEWTNSRGLGICVTANEKMKAAQGVLKLSCLCERVASLFNTAHVEAMFECFESCDEAVSSFG